MTAASEDAVRARREGMRTRMGMLAGTRAYMPVLVAEGLEELGGALYDLSRAGRWKAMGSLISDDVLDLFELARTYDQLPEALARHFGGLVDEVSVNFPEDAPAVLQAELVREIKKLPAAFTGFDHTVAYVGRRKLQEGPRESEQNRRAADP